jgi:hypothetical protein
MFSKNYWPWTKKSGDNSQSMLDKPPDGGTIHACEVSGTKFLEEILKKYLTKPEPWPMLHVSL